MPQPISSLSRRGRRDWNSFRQFDEALSAKLERPWIGTFQEREVAVATASSRWNSAFASLRPVAPSRTNWLLRGRKSFTAITKDTVQSSRRFATQQRINASHHRWRLALLSEKLDH
jgi:hypothetical protein